MPDLRQLAQPLFDRPPLEPMPVDELRRRARRSRMRHGLAVAVALVVVAGVLGGLVVTRSGDSSTPTVSAGPTGPAPLPTAAPVSTLEVGGAIDLAIGFGSVWVPGGEVVRRIDPVANAIAATIPVPGSSDYRAVTVAFDSVWVTDTGTGNLTRIDPTTNTVTATIPLGNTPTRMVAAAGLLWVAQPEPNGPGGQLVPIDPTTNRAGAPLAVSNTDSAPFVVVAASGDSIFASWGTRLLEINARTRAIRTVDYTSPGQPIGYGPGGLAVVGDRLYVVSASNEIVELDLPSLTIRRTSAPIGNAQQLAYGGPSFGSGRPSLWLLTQPSSETSSVLLRVDPSTLRPIGQPIETGLTSVAVASTGDTTWVANFNQGTLTRIDEPSRPARPELCDAPIPIDRRSAEGLPPVDAVVTDRARAEAELQAAEPDLRTRFPNATSFTVGPGYGHAWTRDSQNNLGVVVAVHDFAVIAQLRNRADCPTTAETPVAGTTAGGLPILLAG